MWTNVAPFKESEIRLTSGSGQVVYRRWRDVEQNIDSDRFPKNFLRGKVVENFVSNADVFSGFFETLFATIEKRS